MKSLHIGQLIPLNVCWGKLCSGDMKLPSSYVLIKPNVKWIINFNLKCLPISRVSVLLSSSSSSILIVAPSIVLVQSSRIWISMHLYNYNIMTTDSDMPYTCRCTNIKILIVYTKSRLLFCIYLRCHISFSTMFTKFVGNDSYTFTWAVW